jgi:hypothetical protein
MDRTLNMSNRAVLKTTAYFRFPSDTVLPCLTTCCGINTLLVITNFMSEFKPNTI